MPWSQLSYQLRLCFALHSLYMPNACCNHIRAAGGQQARHSVRLRRTNRGQGNLHDQAHDFTPSKNNITMAVVRLLCCPHTPYGMSLSVRFSVKSAYRFCYVCVFVAGVFCFQCPGRHWVWLEVSCSRRRSRLLVYNGGLHLSQVARRAHCTWPACQVTLPSTV
jgi:hypothetical protein